MNHIQDGVGRPGGDCQQGGEEIAIPGVALLDICEVSGNVRFACAIERKQHLVRTLWKVASVTAGLLTGVPGPPAAGVTAGFGMTVARGLKRDMSPTITSTAKSE